ncbi:TRAP transporter small permease [Phaeobacter sp. PT47_59]|uniref:TRAP transporter small permease n=1 Tax=Phaeobacter sp. PT47_59 TaxID=3029979 RepID=UPI0023800ABE|nr:TRAP transporter small permease [Phaeobacter sp. PT47_59]MDE4176621.1 TRAP transporter small permease [Phaeobacter sp. PT47_59]
MNDTPQTRGAAPKGAVLRAVDGIVWLGAALSTALILIAFALTVYAVFMRYLVNRPLPWSDDVTGWMLVSLIMLGAAEAYRRNAHIAIDLVTTQLNPRASRIQAYFADIAVLAFAIVLGLSSLEAVRFAQSFGAYTSGTVEVPQWIVQLPLVVGAALLGLVALSRILSRLLNGDPQ